MLMPRIKEPTWASDQDQPGHQTQWDSLQSASCYLLGEFYLGGQSSNLDGLEGAALEETSHKHLPHLRNWGGGRGA